MEADGQQLWKLVRPTVKATGPLKVLRRVGPHGDPAESFPEVVDRWGPKRVLRRLCVDNKPIDPAQAAWDALIDLATPGKRIAVPTRDAADRVALDLLDACADLHDNPGAMLTARVVKVLGTKVARMEFEAGSYEGWRVGKRIIVTGSEIGACGLCNNLTDLLAWWIRDWDQVVIKGTGLKPALLRSLGLVRSDNDSWDEDSVRINGRIWLRPPGSAEP